jgi:hypothetical protein
MLTHLDLSAITFELRPGLLVYYESFSGLLPAKVKDCNLATDEIKLCITGKVRHGEIVTTNQLHTIPRSRVRRTCYAQFIQPYHWQ